jgi:Nucleotidyl transferase AbiEii toxin, Type IV TA system
MHKEIFSDNQLKLLPLVKEFKREYYLVGGTAIALYIGHRRSIDFDLFKYSAINPKLIISKITSHEFKFQVTRRVSEQLNINVNGVTFTFFEYPYMIEAKYNFENILRMPALLDLAAMKAYALGRRSKWKDYVDLYFLLKGHFTINQISARGVEIFDQLFSEKLFRAQVCYFNDIYIDEPVEFLVDPPSEDEIRSFLTEKAIDLER